MSVEKKLMIEEENVDFRPWLFLFMRNWVYFLLFVAFALLGAIIITKFKTPQYQLGVNILVKKDDNPLDKAQLFTSPLLTDPYQIQNEEGILKSKSVTREALEQLNFYVAYYKLKGFKKKEIYTQSPFIVFPDMTHLQPLGVKFTVNYLNDSIFLIKADPQEAIIYDYTNSHAVKKIDNFYFEDTVSLGKYVGNKYCRFRVMVGTHGDVHSPGPYLFRFYNIQELTSIFRNFKVDNERGSSILSVKFRYPNPEKAADFLNMLTNVYLRKGVERNNKIAEATIRFINNQLTNVVDSLHTSGTKLQDFKANNRVLDIDFQSEKIYSKIENLEAQKAKLLVKQRYFNYLIDNLRSKSKVTDLVAPTTLDIDDPVLNKLITDLAGFYSEQAEMSVNSLKDNPYQISMENKINDTKQKLIEASKSILEATTISINELKDQISSSENLLLKLPKDQQRLITMERKFKLNDDLYTYLLTRRSEMQIFKASNIPANEVLDHASAEDASMVSPNLRMNVLLALMMGILIPGALLYFREIINNKIRTKEEIQDKSDFPVVGQILGAKTDILPTVLVEPNTVITESYRTLRANLQFVIDETKSNIILITSAIQNEGKSFNAVNLAAIYASYGKKVVLVDFDLRKSRINLNLHLDIENGLSNYLSKHCTAEELIFNDEKINFSIISSGPVPPNPSELVASPLSGELLKNLKNNYDIVIVDSPPIGVVSDAVLLYTYVDIILLVVRQNYTSKEVFENVINDLKARRVERVNIILNDMEMGKGRYGYGYNYGYGYIEKKNSGKKLIRMARRH